jgi:hypothetical protein
MPRTDGRRRFPVGRSIALGSYVAWALVCSFLLGGGLTVFVFFAVWGGVWLGFSLFWRWADETRRGLLRRRGYYS